MDSDLYCCPALTCMMTANASGCFMGAEKEDGLQLNNISDDSHKEDVELPVSSSWVECDNESCQKWRRISKRVMESITPDTKWICSMNEDQNHNSCDIPQESTHSEEKQMKRHRIRFIKTAMKPGRIVWAKMAGYTWWPGIITHYPNGDCLSVVTDQSDGEALWYHVEFFGEHHSHAWVSSKKVRSFNEFSEEQASQATETAASATVSGGDPAIIPPSCQRRAKREETSVSKSKTKGRGKKHKSIQLKPKVGRSRYYSLSLNFAIEEASKWFQFPSSHRLDKISFKKVVTNEGTEKRESSNSSEIKVRKLHDKRNKRGTTKKRTVEGAPTIDTVCPPTKRKKSSAQGSGISHQDAKSIILDSSKHTEQTNSLSNSLLNQTKEEKYQRDMEEYSKQQQAFLADLDKFLKERNLSLTVPIWEKLPINLFDLFMAVQDNGGYQKVTESGKWSAVYCDLTGSNTTEKTPINCFYEKFLLAYEESVYNPKPPQGEQTPPQDTQNLNCMELERENTCASDLLTTCEAEDDQNFQLLGNLAFGDDYASEISETASPKHQRKELRECEDMRLKWKLIDQEKTDQVVLRDPNPDENSSEIDDEEFHQVMLELRQTKLLLDSLIL